MAFQALKETKNSAVRRRLSPPCSPSRRAGSSSTGNKPQPFKSRVIPALDAGLENVLSGGYAFLSDGAKKSLTPTKQPWPVEAAMAGTRSHTSGFSFSNSENPFLHAGKRKAENEPAVSKPATQLPSVAAVTKASPTNPPQKVQKKENAMLSPAPSVAPSQLTEDSAVVASSSKQTEQPPKVAQVYSYKDYSPGPAVVYTCDENEANDLVSCLKGPLGFDMEWRVIFTRGTSPQSRRTALVQISDKNMILLIHLSAMKNFPQKLKELIENPNVTKVGANIHNDGAKLAKDFGIQPGGFVELGGFAHLADPAFKLTYKRKIVSLARMVAMYCDGKVLEKGNVRTGNWETRPLSEQQKKYAANDVYSGLMVYLKLLEIEEENRRLLEEQGLEMKPSNDDPELPKEITAASEIIITGKQTATASISTSTVTTASPTPTPAAITATTTILTPTPTPTLATPTTTIPTSTPATSVSAPSHLPSNSSHFSPISRRPSPQHLKAYTLWYEHKMPMADMRAALRSKESPLTMGTVISYVVRALQVDTSLPYSMPELRTLVQQEAASWIRHRDWILRQGTKGRS